MDALQSVKNTPTLVLKMNEEGGDVDLHSPSEDLGYRNNSGNIESNEQSLVILCIAEQSLKKVPERLLAGE